MLGARNGSQIEEFFTSRRHENLDVFYISQIFFGFSRQRIRNNSDRILLYKQTMRDVEIIYKDIGVYDMMNSKIFVVKFGVEKLTIHGLI